MEPISSYITKLARNVFRSIENHDNPIIRAQTMFTYPHPKLKYAYATAKWQLPLKPPSYQSLKDRAPATLDLSCIKYSSLRPILADFYLLHDSDTIMENPTEMELVNASLPSSRSSTPSMTNCENCNWSSRT
ncbi:hypothetical protein TNCV_237301 [Trichonephila clavipes]|nr:hypothetical protein TNCV_237301 [Trichonephila clavipes]